MPIYMGSTKVEDLHIGGTKVGEGWIWDGTGWVQVYSSVPPFTPSGMTKDGVFSAFSTSFVPVTDWAADAGSVISSNGLVSGGAKEDAKISASLLVDANSGGVTCHAELRIGSTVIASGSGTAPWTAQNPPAELNLEATRTVAEGEVVQLYVRASVFSVRVHPGSRVSIV